MRGSFVVSYLDVAFPDAAPAERVLPLLSSILNAAPTDATSFRVTESCVAVEFFAQPNTSASTELRECCIPRTHDH